MNRKKDSKVEKSASKFRKKFYNSFVLNHSW